MIKIFCLIKYEFSIQSLLFKEEKMKKMRTVLFLLPLFSSLLLILSVQEAPGEEEITIKEVTSFTYVCLPHKGSFADMPEVIGRMWQHTRQQNIFPTMGAMIGVYYSTPDLVAAEELEWEIGFPITPQTLVQAPLEKKQWIFTSVISIIHTGPYDTIGETYTKIKEWMENNNYLHTGPILERYLSNPSQVSLGAQQTEIWVPFKEE
jgi:effector-binding domain-containing protein